MRINIAQYRNSCTQILKDTLIRKSGDNVFDTITNLAIQLSCPTIALLTFYGEITEFTPELNTKIQKFTEFYGYTDIIL